MCCQPVEEVEMKHEHPKLGILQDGKADVCADIHHNLRTERVTLKITTQTWKSCEKAENDLWKC